MLHNICTSTYTKFVTNLLHLLLPEDLQVDNRAETVACNVSIAKGCGGHTLRATTTRSPTEKSVTQKFIEYYASIVTASPSAAFGSYESLSINVSKRLSFKRCVSCCSYQLAADSAFAKTTTISTCSTECETEKNQRKRLLSGIKVNPKNFRYLVRPKSFRIYEKPKDLYKTGAQRFILQPLYRGYLVVISSLGAETRCYNRYGDLVQNFLYDAQFDVSATFEAVVLPVDSVGRVRNWRYWPFRKSYVIYVTDVFRYEQTVLTHSPFCERWSYINRIRGPRVRVYDPMVDSSYVGGIRVNNDRVNGKKSSSSDFNDAVTDYRFLASPRIMEPHTYWTLCERAYYQRSRDMFDFTGGIVIRCLDDSVVDPPIEYRFNLKSYYHFASDQSYSLHGNVCLKESFSAAFDLEMADRRKVCMIYAHDEHLFYVCRFDRERAFQFVHAATLPRFQNLQSTFRDPLYRSEPIYILDPVVRPMGLAYVRIYEDRFEAIIGYEQKLTNGMYDAELESF